MEQIIVHKPAGTVISEQMMAKITKEYTNKEVFYCYRGTDKKWFYSKEKPEVIATCDAFDEEKDGIIIFDKGTHYLSKPNPVNHRESSNGLQWLLNANIGSFSFLSGANDRCSGILFENFLKFCDFNSLNALLKDLCKRYALKSFTVTSGGLAKYGTWFEHEGSYYTNLDFANKLSYDAKTSLKNILAFCACPQAFRAEVSRLEKLTDHEIRIEAAKYPEVAKILQQIG